MSAQIPRDDQWSEGDLRRVLTNVFHVSLGTVTPHMWTQAVTKFISEEGVEPTLREAVRAFNEGVESLGQFDETLDEDEYIARFTSEFGGTPTAMATALLNDLLPRAEKWSSRNG